MKALFNSNPYKSRKLIIDLPQESDEDESKEEDQAPVWCPGMGKNAPSPRQSEYITNPILSQKLRQETDAQLLNRVTFLSRPMKLKTQFKGSTVQRFKNS